MIIVILLSATLFSYLDFKRPSTAFKFQAAVKYAKGRMAEWSKALVLGTSHYGGVGSNRTPVIHTRCTNKYPLQSIVFP